jgi:hypothetical protein
MSLIAAFRGKMQNVVGIGHVTPEPVGDILAKTGTDPGIEPDDIIASELLEPGFGPTPHGDHDRILIHVKVPALVELQTPLPGITKSIWPFARVAILFVPNEFFRPEPSDSPHGKN